MTAKKTDLDGQIERLYREPLDGFTPARNDLAKRIRKAGGKEDAERVQALAKPTPAAWAVNVLFEREGERMEALLASGEKARAGQRAAVSGKGVEALRASLGEVRGLIDELRRRGSAILAESGRAVSRDVIERIGTDLQALALSPDAAESAARRWLDRDLDPPGFEVLAGLQLAGAPVVDLATHRPEREERGKPKGGKAAEPAPKPGKGADGERQRQESAERARREREEELRRRRIEVAEEKAERAREEAESLGEEAATAEKEASEARRRAEAAEAAAGRARDKADRAADRLARAEDEVKEAKAER